MGLDYAVEQHDAVVTVALAGELDLSVADELRQVLSDLAHRPGARQVRVDLAGIRFLDSVTISVLIASQKAAHQAGCRLYVTGAKELVLRVLTVTGVLDLLTDP